MRISPLTADRGDERLESHRGRVSHGASGMIWAGPSTRELNPAPGRRPISETGNSPKPRQESDGTIMANGTVRTWPAPMNRIHSAYRPGRGGVAWSVSSAGRQRSHRHAIRGRHARRLAGHGLIPRRRVRVDIGKIFRADEHRICGVKQGLPPLYGQRGAAVFFGLDLTIIGSSIFASSLEPEMDRWHPLSH
jgi:hypothetical protein